MTGTADFLLCESGRKVDIRLVQTGMYQQRGRAQDWRLLAGISESNLKVPQCIAVTARRPDIVLYSECERIVYFFELTIPFEDAIEEAFERKKLKYAELKRDCQV